MTNTLTRTLRYKTIFLPTQVHKKNANIIKKNIHYKESHLKLKLKSRNKVAKKIITLYLYNTIITQI